MKLWQARFTKESNQKLNDFNSSIAIDSRMFEEDINGSIAHAKMLHKVQLLTSDELNQMVSALETIKQDIKDNILEIDPNAEDIHMFIEQVLTQRIGDTGKKLHTARSRNDQVALDFRMYVNHKSDEIIVLLKTFIETLCHQAEQNLNTIMCGYTHLQRAQPITFAHHLMAYVEMFKRDIERLQDSKKRLLISPLGCGALATTTYPIDRQYTSELLQFHSVSMNSLDGVSDRDFAIEITSAISIAMMHLSRFSEEIVFWCSWEFKYIELDDAFATGSSIMPQKKNPDICELVRGKTGRVYGDLNTLLVMMKGLSLAYNKDMQEDKEATFDAIDTLIICLETVIPMVETMRVLPENMRNAAAKGFINATDCADYLVKKGMPFRDAYRVVGQLVHQAIDQDQVLETLPLHEYQAASELFDHDIYEAISLTTCVMKRNVIGGPAPAVVKAHIETIKKELL